MDEALRRSDFAAVVRAHWRATHGFLLASHGPCREVQTEEIWRIRRSLRRVTSQELPRLEPTGSWLLAVLLCEGDDAQAVAPWAKARAAGDRDRIRFYAHAGADVGEALRPWQEAELGLPLVSSFDNFASFHRQFGADLNVRIYRDATARPARPP